MGGLVKILVVWLIIGGTLIPASLHIWRVLTSESAVSLNENRPLGQWPEWGEMDGRLSAYTQGISAYINDNFGGRVTVVKLRNKVSYKLGMGSDLVVRGRTPAWYFFDDVVMWESFQGKMNFDSGDVERWIASLSRFKESVTETGAQFAAIIPPDKARIYPEHAPLKYGQRGTHRFVSSLYTHPDSRHAGLVDIEEAISKKKLEGMVYFKTDTHWTHRGAYPAYLAVMRAFNMDEDKFSVLDAELLRYHEISAFSGDLINLLGLEGTISEDLTDVAPPKHAHTFEQTIINDAPGFRAGWRTLVESNGVEDKRTLVIVGDSFSHKLLPFFRYSFDKIILMHHRNGDFDVETVMSYEPDAVLFAPVERSAITLRNFAKGD